MYAKAVLKFAKLDTVAQQREAVTRGRSLLPYRLRYNWSRLIKYSLVPSGRFRCSRWYCVVTV
ncbi:MAG: hypothetical protein LBK06_02480 [Planctomycetaceae bacterium]|nr:hypothetical protein [Planctomycetaceae bacterium]